VGSGAVIEAPDDMLDRMFAIADAYGEFLRRNKNGEESGNRTDPQVCNDTAAEELPRPRAAQRLDWLLDLLEEVALAEPKKIDPLHRRGRCDNPVRRPHHRHRQRPDFAGIHAYR
jgi:hypothetical protein